MENFEEAHYYDLPHGFKKPKSYPGLTGSVFLKNFNNGTLNLSLVDPQHPDLTSRKFRTAVIRNIVQILIQEKGEARIHDPEWVLKNAYPDAMIKNLLKERLETALSAMFEKKVFVTLGGFKQNGWNWWIECPQLPSLLKH